MVGHEYCTEIGPSVASPETEPTYYTELWKYDSVVVVNSGDKTRQFHAWLALSYQKGLRNEK